VLRVDSRGNVVWDYAYGGNQTEQANDVVQTSDGGFLVVGFTYSFGGFPAWVLRLSAGGAILWQTSYSPPTGEGDADSVVATSDGGFVLAGYYRSPVTPESFTELWLFKINANGAILWQKAYGGGRGDLGYSIYQTSDQGLAIAGYTDSFGASSSAIWVLRLDSQGNVLWQRAYGGGGVTVSNEAYSVVQVSDGGFVVAGFSMTQVGLRGNQTAPVLRLDSGGNVLWSRTYGSGEIWQALASPDGGVLLVGTTGIAAMVLKLDPNSSSGFGCSLEHSFNSTTVNSTVAPVSTDDSGSTTKATVSAVTSVVTDTSASVSAPCFHLLATIAERIAALWPYVSIAGVVSGITLAALGVFLTWGRRQRRNVDQRNKQTLWAH
jgi:hypothetical protein